MTRRPEPTASLVRACHRGGSVRACGTDAPRRRTLAGTAWPLLLATVLVACATPAPGQGLGVLGGGGSGAPVLVERDEVRRRALDSFRGFAEELLASDGEAAAAGEVRDKADTVIGEFTARLDRTLLRLEGDGVLGAGEVEAALGRLRGEYESELRTVVSALRIGFAPPPLSRGFDSAREYALALTRYTFTVRNPVENWARLGAWLVLGLLLAWGLNRGARRAARRLAASGLPAIGQVFESLAGPLYLAALSLSALFGTRQLWIPALVEASLRGVIEMLLAGSLFWLLWNACPGAATAVTRFIRRSYESELDGHARNILVRVLRVAVALGLALVVVRFILDTSLTGMLAGLGVLGLGLYLVLRGTLENVAASVTIFGDEPFRVGDLVIHDDRWGVIEDIGFRSTRFRTLDGHLVTIPNSELIATAIHNAGARPWIRRRFRLGLPYDTAPDEVREAISIVEDILADHRGMPADQPPHVVFESFGAYDLQLLVQYHYEPPDYWQALALDTEVNLKILERFAEAGIEIAFPTQTSILAGRDGAPPRVALVDERESNAGEAERQSAAGDGNEGGDEQRTAHAAQGSAGNDAPPASG